MQAFASLFTSGAAGAGAAGTSAGIGSSASFVSQFGNPGGSTGGGGGFNIASLFSKGALMGSSQNIPILGPVVSIFQAFDDEKRAKGAAARIDFNAKTAEIEGKAQTVSALRNLNDVQAHNVVAAFTSGGGLAGSRGRVIQDVSRDAQLGFDLIRTNAEIKSGTLRQEARQIRKIAKFNRRFAVGKSLFTLATGGVLK